MTVERQEQLMEEMIKFEKKDDKDYNKEFNKRLMWKTLQIIDKTVKLDNIKNMHPDDYVILFGKIWNKGRELTKGDEDFR